MRQRYALDACILTSIVNSDDHEHFSCYSFFRNLHDVDKAIWVVPGLILFEFQATQSRRYKELHPGCSVYRNAPLFHENSELYHVTPEFLIRVYELNLYDKFSTLRGADLLYACIAKVEGIPLVTHDSHFDPYHEEITLIKPRDFMKESGTVTIEAGNAVYSVGYEVTRGSRLDYVRLDTGQATHLGGPSALPEARLLLQEMIDSGLADRMGLRQDSKGSVKTKPPEPESPPKTA